MNEEKEKLREEILKEIEEEKRNEQKYKLKNKIINQLKSTGDYFTVYSLEMERSEFFYMDEIVKIILIKNDYLIVLLKEPARIYKFEIDKIGV